MIRYLVHIDTAKPQGFEHDASDDVVSFDMSRGRRQRMGMGDVGTLSVTVRSDDGRYYLDRPEAITGLAVGRHIKLQALVNNLRLYDIFYGRITAIRPVLAEPGGRPWQAEITAEDSTAVLAVRTFDLDLLKGNRFATLFNKVLAKAKYQGPIETTEVNGAVQFAWWENATALAALEEIVVAEGGSAFIGKNGAAVFHGRHYRSRRSSTPKYNLSSVVNSFRESQDDIVTDVTVSANRRKATKVREIWSGSTFQLGARKERTFRVQFSDPIIRHVNPAPRTDYKASLPNDDSVDRTNNLRVKVKFDFSTHAKVIVKNASAKPIKVTKLRVRGVQAKALKPTKIRMAAPDLFIVGKAAVGATRTDAPDSKVAGAVEGEFIYNRVEIDNNLIQAPRYARSIGRHYLKNLSRAQPRIEVSVIAKAWADINSLLDLEIDDRVTFIDSDLGLNGDYWVDAVSVNGQAPDRDNVLRMSLVLFPAFHIDDNRKVGSASVASSEVLSSISFPGTTSSFLEVPDHDLLSPHASGGDMTIETWVKPDSPLATQWVLAKGTASNWEYGLKINSNGSVEGSIWQLGGSAHVFAVSATGAVTANKSSHLSMVLSGGNYLRIYLDGTLIASSTSFFGTSSNGSASLLIGKRSDGSPFKGKIWDTRLWGFAKDQEEVLGDMDLELEGSEIGDEDSEILLALWKAKDGDGSSVVTDSTGNGLDAALNGSLTWDTIEAAQVYS